MKQLLLLLLIFNITIAESKNIYISAKGADSNTGLTQATAWQTITKLNASFGVIAPGDSILFKCGETFYGSIIVSKSGTSALPIVIGAYGTGANPIITGFTTLTTWTNSGGGIWISNVSSASTGLIVVTINNNLQRLGRYPNANATNAGYFTYAAVSGTTLTGPALSSITDWTGAEVVVRKLHWIIDRCRITSHSGGTVTYTNPTDVSNSAYPGKAGYGYFFQDDIRTLDQFGEWFLNKSTKDLSINFGTANPASYSIKASTIDTLLNVGGGPDGRPSNDNITICNLSFAGANKQAVYARYGLGITVKNCTFNNNFTAINLNNTAGSTTRYNVITNCLNNGIQQSSYSTYSTAIQYDTIKNTGLFAGMGGSGDGSYTGITQGGDNTIVQNNEIDSTGYVGLVFTGNNVQINYNYITNFCNIKDDGGGIYTASGDGSITQNNRVVSYNTVIGGIGAVEGTPNFTAPGTTYDAHGIYMDAGANHAYVHHNTIANIPQGQAIFLNMATDLIVSYNTFYNVLKGTRFDRMPNEQLIRNITYTGNISYPTASNFFYWNGSLNYPSTVDIQTDMQAMFTRLDSNYYRNDQAAPFDYFYHLTDGGKFYDPAALNLSSWQIFINGDSHSKAISTGTIIFVYNPGGGSKTITLDAKYLGVDGTTVYNGTITLAPYTSAILIKSGAIDAALKADAGTDISLVLPTKILY